MIKVMHICSDSIAGGATRTLYTLLKHADKTAVHHVVIIPSSNPFYPDICALDVETIPLKSPPDSSFSLRAAVECIGYIRSHHPDVIHTHGAVFGRIAGYLCGVRALVYTRHTYNTVIASRLVKSLNRHITSKAVAVSLSVIDQIKASGIDENNIVVIENGCDEIPFEDRSVNNKCVLLYLGRIVKGKGLDTAIHAVKKLRSNSDFYSLLIVGDGEYRGELERLATREHIDDIVTFKPFQKNIIEIIRGSHIMLNCSFENEALSNSLIEAMSAGIPVCVSDIAGNRCIVDDGVNGMLFDSGSSESLCRAIELVCADYYGFSLRARETYRKRFNADLMTAKYEAVWKEEYEKSKNS